MMPSPVDTNLGARFFALIPCAGQGSRAGGATVATNQAKQYREVAGQPMVLHTLAAFLAVERLAGVLVVVASGDRFFKSLGPQIFSVADCGGASRAASVHQGLDALLQIGALPSDWVLVHDAARCLITPAQINQLISACKMDAVGGLLAYPLPDTLKQVADGRVTSTLDRADKWLAQTPQMFRIGLLMQALDAAEIAGIVVTDESSAIEALGLWPKVVAGSAQNFKVTYAEDFVLADAILRHRLALA